MDKIKQYLNYKLVTLRSNKVILKKGVKVSYRKNKFEYNIVINENCDISGSSIGKYTYVSNNCSLPKTKIGAFCSIAPEVKLVIGNHPIKNYVTTHPAFFSNKKQCGVTFCKETVFKDELIYASKDFLCEIGNDVWIGYGAKIMNGVKIGNGAVIGAGAVVTKNIEPYSINVGVPCKKISSRFEKRQIELLEKSKWWNKNDTWLEKNVDKFRDIKEFEKLL